MIPEKGLQRRAGINQVSQAEVKARQGGLVRPGTLDPVKLPPNPPNQKPIDMLRTLAVRRPAKGPL